MSAIATPVQPSVLPTSRGPSGWIKRYPLATFFILAYGITWTLVLPILVSQRGFGLLVLPEEVLLVFFLLVTFMGPFPAALIVTGVTEGRAGVSKLLRRIVLFRFGLPWYLIALLVVPLLFLAGYSVAMGAEPFSKFLQNWPLLLSFYLPATLFGIIYPGLGEEPGWRGFALPRLQIKHGALVGTLIMGTLHALWHFPIYFIPGTILPGQFDLTAFIANSGAIIGQSFFYTWIFNHARGSIFVAMLLHGASNAASALIPQIMTPPDDAWATFKIFVVSAVFLIVLTGGRLGYQGQESLQPAAAPVPTA